MFRVAMGNLRSATAGAHFRSAMASAIWSSASYGPEHAMRRGDGEAKRLIEHRAKVGIETTAVVPP